MKNAGVLMKSLKPQSTKLSGIIVYKLNSRRCGYLSFRFYTNHGLRFAFKFTEGFKTFTDLQ